MDAETKLREFLALIDPSKMPGQRRPSLPFPTAFLFGEGRFWTPAPLPPDIPFGTRKMCFQNAFQLMMSNPRRYRYAEGYALEKDGGVPLEHAWCVTESGTVVDPTWRTPERTAYFGVALDAMVICRVLAATETYGVLDYATWRVAGPILHESVMSV